MNQMNEPLGSFIGSRRNIGEVIKWLFVGTMRRDELSGDLSCVQFMFSFNPATQPSVCILLRKFRRKKSSAPSPVVFICTQQVVRSRQVLIVVSPCAHNLHLTKKRKNIRLLNSTIRFGWTQMNSQHAHLFSKPRIITIKFIGIWTPCSRHSN